MELYGMELYGTELYGTELNGTELNGDRALWDGALWDGALWDGARRHRHAADADPPRPGHPHVRRDRVLGLEKEASLVLVKMAAPEAIRRRIVAWKALGHSSELETARGGRREKWARRRCSVCAYLRRAGSRLYIGGGVAR